MLRRSSTLPLLALACGLLACPVTGPGGGGGGGGGGPVVIYPEVPVGSLVITEILAHPNVGRPEFLELVNVSDEAIDLLGCRLSDGGTTEHSFNIASEHVVAPGGFVLLASEDHLGSTLEDLPVQVVWEELTLSQTDELESVEIACPDGTGARQIIDEVAFHWSGLELRRGHSWQLVEEPDVGTNDDPLNWCEAPTQDDAIYATVDGQPDYGSPGAAAVCETLGGAIPSSPGQVVITEILVDEFTGLREWFELHNPTAEDLDLRTCSLGDAPVDESTDPNTHTLDAELGDTVLPAGGFMLLSKSDVDVSSDGSLVSDYPYGSLGFNNSDLQHLWLDCPLDDTIVRIDEILYDWGEYGSDFEGRSISLSADSYSAEANDDAANWCLPDDDALYFEITQGDEPETFRAWGSPGEPNPPCPVPDAPPAVGEMIFTEILVRSAGAEIGHNEEWFEMLYTGSSQASLLGCTIVNGDDSGDADEHVIEDPLGVTVAPGDYFVFVRSSAADTLACGLPHDYQYGTNITFSNDAAETLTLVCPGDEGDQVIDTISFDGGFEPGIPWQLHSDWETAEDNDDAANWCSQGATESYSWSCTVGAETNYGTPQASSSCP